LPKHLNLTYIQNLFFNQFKIAFFANNPNIIPIPINLKFPTLAIKQAAVLINADFFSAVFAFV